MAWTQERMRMPMLRNWTSHSCPLHRLFRHQLPPILLQCIRSCKLPLSLKQDQGELFMLRKVSRLPIGDELMVQRGFRFIRGIVACMGKAWGGGSIAWRAQTRLLMLNTVITDLITLLQDPL